MMDIGEIGCGGVDWICLAQDKEKWRALVNKVINVLVLIVVECILLRLYTIKHDNHVTSFATILSMQIWHIASTK
jgi:hypothetical protein